MMGKFTNRNENTMTAFRIAENIRELASSVMDDARAGEVDCALGHIAAIRTATVALEDELRNGNLYANEPHRAFSSFGWGKWKKRNDET